ncbi:helix-turn-helix transcriptional regulator [Roseisolibacter agri]|uniref:Transcriptional regulator n=1 Tax=Roseisolibacter agri TaxID=2014610 RepID=A0AA37Q7N2_9BACT|nr:WYL domain-containing protein [Roseisolibacter agri]GLC27759.1 transcriptional regulator [Roseisolibacter agri]
MIPPHNPPAPRTGPRTEDRRRTPDTAAAQLRRILDLVPHVADGEPHPIAELAQHAGVDERTRLRDLQSLSSRFDAPGGFVDGLSIFVETETAEVHTNHFLRPMGLTVPELRALELGLAVLAAERPAEGQRAIDGARARLREALGTRATAAALDVSTAGPAAPLDAAGTATLAVLREARLNGHKVQLAYRKAEVSDASERIVAPYALVVASGAWYLVARCETSDALRVFRIDRVVSAVALAEPFTVPESFDVRAVFREGRAFVTDAPPETLVVRYGPRVARWVAEREGRPLDDDGSLTLEHPLADINWAVRHLLQYGPDVEVLGPDSVRQALVERVDAMLASLDEPWSSPGTTPAGAT